MLKPKIQFFADAGDAGTANVGTADVGTADAGAAAETAHNGTEGGQNADEGSQTGNNSVEELNAEIARLKAEMAKQKTSLDKATSEAGNLRKELRSKMTQEQIDAAEKKEAEERQAKELEDLRRKVARAESTKSVMSKLGVDEEAAGNLADHLFGAADIDNALLEIQKAWQAKEAALRKEYGKIPGPGAGADSNSPEAQAVRLASEIGKQRNAVNEQAQKAMSAYIR